MLNVPIWVFVIICVLAFIGAAVIVFGIVSLIYAVVDAHYQVKQNEEKIKDLQCPEKVEKGE